MGSPMGHCFPASLHLLLLMLMLNRTAFAFDRARERSNVSPTETNSSDWRRAYLAHHPQKLESLIVLLEDDTLGLISTITESQQFRKAKWPSVAIKWPEDEDGFPLVLYKFGDGGLIKDAIEDGLDHWRQHSCVRFKEKTNDNLEPFINFILTDKGCFSPVGRMFFLLKGQPLGLSIGCMLSLGTVVHEIGHSLGFFHEQSRKGRDEHVVINWTKMRFDSIFNYFPALTENYDIPYDYYSVMHYSMQSFSVNGASTLVTKDPLMQGLMGNNNEGLSHMDKRLANILYGCIEKWTKTCNLASDPCKNYGYLGVDCICVCPPGAHGDNCQDLQMTYNDALVSKLLPHNSVVTTESNISTPNYPEPQQTGVVFTTVMSPPPCFRVKVTFHAFDLRHRCDDVGIPDNCCADGLEIRTNGDDPANGVWYCGTEIAPGTVFESTHNNKMVFYFRGFNYSNVGYTAEYKGYHASVAFVKQSNCI